MVWFQDSILKHLHHHTLSNMFFDEISKAHCAWILSCFGPRMGAWPIVRLIFPSFWLVSLVFSITLQIWLGLPHLSIVSIPQCVCTHPINLMGIYLLHYVHGNKHTWTHDAIHDTFATIVWDVGFHVGREQLHALLKKMFNFSHWRVNIVLTKYGIRTLVDIVIVDLTRMDLLSRSCTTQGFVAYNAFQTK
jgi:hypothetical protein